MLHRTPVTNAGKLEEFVKRDILYYTMVCADVVDEAYYPERLTLSI